MNRSFRGLRVVITGGSSGIGLACAQYFVREGAAVCIIARRAQGIQAALTGLREIARESSQASAAERVVGYTADVAQYRQLKSAYRKYRRDHGVPHIWINCAGFARPGYFEELSLRQFYRQTETNYYGAVHGVKTVLSDWIARGEGGAIVNVASVAAYMGVFGFTAYAPTKFALLGFSESLRQELKRHQISVHVVCPPDTDTPGLRAESTHTPAETAALTNTAKALPAARVAESLLRGLRRNQFMIFPDFESRWLYAISRWFPGLTRRIVDAKTARARKQARSPA